MFIIDAIFNQYHWTYQLNTFYSSLDKQLRVHFGNFIETFKNILLHRVLFCAVRCVWNSYCWNQHDVSLFSFCCCVEFWRIQEGRHGRALLLGPISFITTRIRRMREEDNSFSWLVCPQRGGGGVTYPGQVQGTTPSQVTTRGRGYPKLPPPSHGTYPPPGQVRMGGRYPMVHTPLAKVPTPPPGEDRGRGYPKAPTSPPPAKLPTPSPLAKDLPHGGRYASCVHAGGLSCFHAVFEKKNGQIIGWRPHLGGWRCRRQGNPGSATELFCSDIWIFFNLLEFFVFWETRVGKRNGVEKRSMS